jgi:uncharacterized protein (DUF427 family)
MSSPSDPSSTPQPDDVTESVWEYPRPPRVEPVPERIRVVVEGLTIADTTRAFRVLETSHPPSYYVPPEDVRGDLLPANARTSYCEFKGRASYVDLQLPGELTASGRPRTIASLAWTYPAPAPGYEAIRGHLSFYASRVDEAWVGDERATAQEGDFYGGWITSRVAGPFKGGPGTGGW